MPRFRISGISLAALSVLGRQQHLSTFLSAPLSSAAVIPPTPGPLPPPTPNRGRVRRAPLYPEPNTEQASNGQLGKSHFGC